MYDWLTPTMFQLQDAIDILVVAILIYFLLNMIKGTRAALLVKGIIMLIVIQQISEIIGLFTVNFILRGATQVGIFAILVVFQPELRRGLEQMGNSRFGQFFRIEDTFASNSTQETVTEICKAVQYLSKNKMGSIIVMERRTKLNDVIQTGVTIKAQISSELLVNIFSSNTPLHDGAVVIREQRIMAASCLLPLTQNINLGTELGTRHRAAIGNSETSDSFTIVTSEETGTISVARHGALTRNLTVQSLEKALMKLASDNAEEEKKSARKKKRKKEGVQ